jgi:hypothetical protein
MPGLPFELEDEADDEEDLFLLTRTPAVTAPAMMRTRTMPPMMNWAFLVRFPD